MDGLSENRPLPWKAVNICGTWDVTNDAGDPREEYSVLEYATEGEAKFIALACNSHGALLAALIEAESMLRVAMREDLHFPKNERNEIIANHPGMKQIRAAIALAKGV